MRAKPLPHSPPKRRTRELQRGRVSIPGARYFITLRFGWNKITGEPTSALAVLDGAVCTSIDTMCGAGDWRVLCRTLMPDHVHLLVELGSRLPLSQCTAKF